MPHHHTHHPETWPDPCDPCPDNFDRVWSPVSKPPHHDGWVLLSSGLDYLPGPSKMPFVLARYNGKRWWTMFGGEYCGAKYWAEVPPFDR